VVVSYILPAGLAAHSPSIGPRCQQTINRSAWAGSEPSVPGRETSV